MKNIRYNEEEGNVYIIRHIPIFLFLGGEMVERAFQPKVIAEIEQMLPGCIILKMDTSYMQGSPDLLILYKDRWATLECKKSLNEKKQPNQDYYVDLMNEMSFSRFICPENKEEVLDALQQTFRSRRTARFSKCK